MQTDVVQDALQILEDTRLTLKPVRLVRPQRLQLPLMYLEARTIPELAGYGPAQRARGTEWDCCLASLPILVLRLTIRQRQQQQPQ